MGIRVTWRDDIRGPLSLNIVFDGDSITTDLWTPTPYMSPTIDLLTPHYPDTTWAEFGVGGQTWVNMTSDAVAQIDSLIDLSKDRNIVTAFAGHNDMRDQTYTDAYNDAVAYCQARQAAGWQVVIITQMARNDNWGTTYPDAASWDAARLSYNQLIRDNWGTFADAICDVAGDDRIGDLADVIDGTYFVDYIHPNDAGHAIIAELLNTSIRTLL